MGMVTITVVGFSRSRTSWTWSGDIRSTARTRWMMCGPTMSIAERVGIEAEVLGCVAAGAVGVTRLRSVVGLDERVQFRRGFETGSVVDPGNGGGRRVDKVVVVEQLEQLPVGAVGGAEVESVETFSAAVAGSAIHNQQWLPPAVEFVQRHTAALPCWTAPGGTPTDLMIQVRPRNPAGRQLD